MVIPPIPPIPPSPPAAPATGAATAGATGSSGAGFSNTITQAMDQLQATQNQATSSAAAAATGQGNVADAMIAATQASLDTQVTASLVTKALSAFNQIMNMPV
ncbi:MAG: flagellar hook-basal body complex protein FliE [Acidimicrobiales bacterium]